MDNNSEFINPSSLVNILTLRYDPSIIPNLPTKNFQDFKSTQDEPNIHQIEKSICNNIEQKLRTFDNKKISGLDLVVYLNNYAATGTEYVKTLTSIINQNKLTDFDDSTLMNTDRQTSLTL